MKISVILWAVVIFAVEIVLQHAWIWVQNSGKLSLFQEQKSYGPQIDVEQKTKTPSMGGVVFLVIAAGLIFSHTGAAHVWVFASACGLVGFADDALKFFKHSSEGFSSVKKFCAQIVISAIYAVWFEYNYGINLWAETPCPVWLGVPLIIFLSVGLQNAVNVTDGLDGLAAGAVALSLVGIAVVGKALPLNLAAGFALTLGFLWHNSHPAKVFMGDTGSHFLAGMLFALALSVPNGSLWNLVSVSFLFGIEIIAVALQIIAIRKWGRKIFKMAPLHHHFQLSGWKETLIVNRFWLAHIVGMAVLLTL